MGEAEGSCTDTRFVELGRHLCEVRAGQYWRLENLKSFDEFLERRFPESRRKAYYLMSIHGTPAATCEEGTKRNRLDDGERVGAAGAGGGSTFDCAPWVHNARSLPREEFTREVEKELTGRETEPQEMVFSSLDKSKLIVYFSYARSAPRKVARVSSASIEASPGCRHDPVVLRSAPLAPACRPRIAP